MPSLQEVTGQGKPNVTEVETPSGLKIAYCPEPRGYWIDGVSVPSVTEVLQILHKPALMWWGMKVGVEGVLALNRKNILVAADFEPEAWSAPDPWTVEEIVKVLTREKLTVNHVRDKAGDRGTNVHMALERWAETGDMPDPEKWPEEERGYVRGLVAFLEAVQPSPFKSELMVGSKKKGFAGRFDLLAMTEGGPVKPTPRKSREIPSGMGIWDLKSGKGIYPDSHFLQLAAYRFAYEESHWDKKTKVPARVDYEAIVNVREDGSWDCGISDRQPWQYLAVKSAWEALQ